MTLLRSVPGVLSRAFGAQVVEYWTGAAFVAMADAHASSVRQSRDYDQDGARERLVSSIAISMDYATAPALVIGQRVRVAGVEYAVATIKNDDAHGIRTWVVERDETDRRTPDRGRTR